MTQSKYSFVRSELRVLQNTCEGDNEKFLNFLADNIGQQDEKIKELKNKLAMAEHRVRSGGQFTQDEIDNAGRWI